jgi:hypothetical protein
VEGSEAPGGVGPACRGKTGMSACEEGVQVRRHTFELVPELDKLGSSRIIPFSESRVLGIGEEFLQELWREVGS